MTTQQQREDDGSRGFTVYQTYTHRCLRCDEEITFTLRDTNVNTNITDVAILQMYSKDIGKVVGEYCESCMCHTAKRVVAYSLTEDTPNA